MGEHKWAKNMKRTFRKSFNFYLNAVVKNLHIIEFEVKLPKYHGVSHDVKSI
jgi:hypothetical protein